MSAHRAPVRATQDDLLDALRHALQAGRDAGEDAPTSIELSEELGLAVNKVRRAIAAGLKDGTIERVTVWREDISGRRQRHAGFRRKG